jgi:PDZ domain-containing protein
MERRGATLLVGALLLLALTWQALTVKVPYVELGPGPTVNTLGDSEGKPIITVDGAATSTSAGQLRLTTVNVRDEGSLIDVVRGWLAGDAAVVPRELVYPPDKSEKQVDQENAQQFQQSQTSAETVALRKLGYPVRVNVTEVAQGFPAEKELKAGDTITSIDGTPVTSLQKLRDLLNAKPAGQARQVGYLRGGVAGTAAVATVKGDDGRPRLGVVVEQKQPTPFTVKFDLDRIGGPSAGMMFTLAVIDKLTPEDLTGGLRIAGTGTIDDEGNVGQIGGIPLKMLGAKRDRATIFLTPASNCAEALDNPVPGLKLIRVATIDDALNALTELRAGRTPPLCTK